MKPTICTPREAEAVALSLGFQYDRSTGSHRIYKNSDGLLVAIPFHPGDVPLGTLRSVIKQMDISVKEFNRRV